MTPRCWSPRTPDEGEVELGVGDEDLRGPKRHDRRPRGAGAGGAALVVGLDGGGGGGLGVGEDVVVRQEDVGGDEEPGPGGAVAPEDLHDGLADEVAGAEEVEGEEVVLVEDQFQLGRGELEPGGGRCAAGLERQRGVGVAPPFLHVPLGLLDLQAVGAGHGSRVVVAVEEVAVELRERLEVAPNCLGRRGRRRGRLVEIGVAAGLGPGIVAWLLVGEGSGSGVGHGEVLGLGGWPRPRHRLGSCFGSGSAGGRRPIGRLGIRTRRPDVEARNVGFGRGLHVPHSLTSKFGGGAIARFRDISPEFPPVGRRATNGAG